MDERLNLEFIRNMFTDIFDFPQRKLPCRDDPLCPELMPEEACLIVCVIGLRTDMKLQIRGVTLREHEHTGVRDKDRIRPDF